MSTWAVRITLPLSTTILTPARVAPWYRKHTHIEFNGSVFDYQEHWLMLHSGTADSYPLGEANANQSTWYAGYLPGGGAPVLSANVDIVDGGDFEQLSEIRFLVANQMADGTLMSDWLKNQYGEHLMSGAVCEVYLDLPSEATPAPVARWTGNVRSATPVGVNLELVCESIALANEIGEDLGAGVIRPIVYGSGHKVRIPKVRETEFAPWPLQGFPSGNWPLVRHKQSLEVSGISSPGVEPPWITLDTNDKNLLLEHLPGGNVATYDWYVEITSGKGKGEMRRLAKGHTLAWFDADPGNPVVNGELLPWNYARWRIPIEQAFVDDAGVSILQTRAQTGDAWDAPHEMSMARIVRRSVEFGLPSHIPASQLIADQIASYVKINSEFVRCWCSSQQWDLGADSSSVKAIGHQSNPLRWHLLEHIVPEGDEFTLFYDGTSSVRTDTWNSTHWQTQDAQALLTRLNDGGQTLESMESLGSTYRDFAVGYSGNSIPWHRNPLALYACAYAESAADSPGLAVSVNAYRLQQWNTGFYYPDFVLPYANSGGGRGVFNGFPPRFGAHPGANDWKSRASKLTGFSGLEGLIDLVIVRANGGRIVISHGNDPYTYEYYPVDLGKLSLFAEYETDLNEVWIDAPGPTPASGSEELVAKWSDRLALVESDEFLAGTEIIADHAHLIEDVAYRYLVGSVDAAAIEQAYQDREAKTMTSLVAPSTGRPRAELSLMKSAQVGDVYAQVCRDGMFVGALNGAGAITLKAWLARTGLAEADATILVATEADPDVFDGFSSTGVDKVITAPLIRYAVEGDAPSKAIQILRPDATDFDESYAIGFESVADGQRAWELCRECYKATQLVHVREMVFSTVGDYASLMRLILQERGTPFLRWIGLPKDIAPLLVSAGHPAAHLPLGSRVLLVDPRHCPSGRYGTISSRKIDLNTWKCSLTLLMDLPT